VRQGVGREHSGAGGVDKSILHSDESVVGIVSQYSTMVLYQINAEALPEPGETDAPASPQYLTNDRVNSSGAAHILRL